MKIFLALTVIFLRIYGAAAIKHSLQDFYTASSGIPGVPEFVSMGMVDRQPIFYYESVIKKTIPKQDWMAKNEGPDYWERETQTAIVAEQVYKVSNENIKPRFNQTGVLPSVSLLQKSSSSPVTCHATGFHPNRAELIWRKDGVELQKCVDKGEILTNNDGTFQMRADLKLSVKLEDWERYDCVFQLSGETAIVTKLDKAVIKTSRGSLGLPVVVVVVLIGVLVLLAVCITVAIILKRRNNGYKGKGTSDPLSNEDSDTKKATLA